MKVRVFALVLTLLAMPAMAQTPSGRIVVHDESGLPRFSYAMKLPPSQLIVADDATFAPFAAAVRADVDKTLSDYDIQDPASLRDFLQAKLALQLLAHDNAGVRATIASLRAAETKPESKLTAGRLILAKLDADAGNGDFSELDRKAVDALPWDVVQDSIKSTYGFERIFTKDAAIGFIKHDLDPIAQSTGTLDGQAARAMVEVRAQFQFTAPLYALDVPVLKAYIARHNVVKADIWSRREVALTPAMIKAPVAIGIWDSGVDPSDYPQNMYVDKSGKHGLAFADDGSPSPLYLYPLPPSTKSRYPTYVKLMTGFSDLQTATDSPDADAVRTYLKSLSVDQAARYAHDMALVDEYAHGSHVAGIAVRGNPAARVVVARFDDNITDLRFPPTIAWAKRMAADFAATGAYFRANNVRVVNMSWGDTASEFEEWLAKTDKISDVKTRKAKAQQLFAIWRSAIEHVIASNPRTLFVTAAGNGDNNASFSQDVPASLRYPNLITVGATNQAGDATGFTSYGPTVAVYADGFHVLSKIPGGHAVKFSGTSMASPNVANLAAKLFAIDPSLTPERARALIIKGATLSDDGKRKLIDPKRSIALLMHYRISAKGANRAL